MFIPLWAIVVVVHLVFLALFFWAVSSEGDYDFSGLFKIPFVGMMYLGFWVVYLLLTR